MHRMAKFFVVFIVGIVTTLFCEQLLANDGTPPKIFELIQEGQDVVITLEIVEDGEPGISDAYTIERSRSSKEKTLFSGKTFDIADAVDKTGRCTGLEAVEECAQADGIPEQCEGFEDVFSDIPDECYEMVYECADCDDDRTLECPIVGYGGIHDVRCETVYYFDVVDQCVPAGTIAYTLTASDWPYTYTETLQVNDSSEECTVPNDNVGCSITAVGTPETNQLVFLALLMIGIGSIGLLFGPRQPRK
jgi:hypothetical protein